MLVEAKPVKADLEKHVEQAVKYGYNKHDVPFVMLTGFESIMVFDTTLKPNFKNLKKGLKVNLIWHECERVQRQIDQVDSEIDELVYKLYGITEEEKQMIEAQ